MVMGTNVLVGMLFDIAMVRQAQEAAWHSHP